MTRLICPLLLGLQRAFAGFDPRLDAVPVPPPMDRSLAPIFILGAPRTGSTLLYQLMLMTLPLGYISNVMALFPRYMGDIARHARSRMVPYSYGLSASTYGYVAGLWGPNEAGKIFRHWFDEKAEPERSARVRKTLAAITNAFERPILVKNMWCALRLQELRETFPEARFVVVSRHPLFTAQSILDVRKRFLGDPKKWWSIAPPGYESTLKESPEYQVVWQVMEIERIIESALDWEPDSSIRVSYSNLCRDPVSALNAVARGFSLKITNTANLDAMNLRAAETIRVSSNIWRELELSYDRICAEQGQHGKRSAWKYGEG